MTPYLRATLCSTEEQQRQGGALWEAGSAPHSDCPGPRVQWGLGPGGGGHEALPQGGLRGSHTPGVAGAGASTVSLRACPLTGATVMVPLALGDREMLCPLSSPSMVAGTSVSCHSLPGVRSHTCWYGGEGRGHGLLFGVTCLQGAPVRATRAELPGRVCPARQVPASSGGTGEHSHRVHGHGRSAGRTARPWPCWWWG